MDNGIWVAIAGILGVLLGIAAMIALNKSKTLETQKALQEAETARRNAEAAALEAKRLGEESRNLIEARMRELQIEARENAQIEAAKLRETIERENVERRQELKDSERRLRDRDSQLDRRAKGLDAKEKTLADREIKIEERTLDIDKLVEEQTRELERVAQLPQPEARELLLSRVAEQTREEMNHVARRIEDEMREESETRARKVITMAIQRCAVDQTAESSVSVVALPSDDIKGRIIGREGRNIRTFEQLSGCDLIIDDTPEAVVVSSFEPVRREIAKIALANLVNDGRIHPARIEDMLNKAKTEVQQKMREAADRATSDANVRLTKPLLEVFGRLLVPHILRPKYSQTFG